jgi:hypothetical protein
MTQDDDTTLADFRLSRSMRRIFAPVARIVCTDEIVEYGLEEAVLDHVELSLRSMPWLLRIGLVAGAHLFNLSAVLFPSSFGRTFRMLPRQNQERHFRRFWLSNVMALRQLAKGMKALVALAYFEHPAVLSRLAYHPERWIAEVAARRVRDYAADIKRADEIVVAPAPLVQLGRRAREQKAS